jgi:hypothetical protein
MDTGRKNLYTLRIKWIVYKKVNCNSQVRVGLERTDAGVIGLDLHQMCFKEEF